MGAATPACPVPRIRASSNGRPTVRLAGSTTRGPDDQIFLADPATGERTTVILVTDIPEAHFVRSLAFSPDGGALVVCVSVEPVEASTRLYTIGLEGEDLTR